MEQSGGYNHGTTTTINTNTDTDTNTTTTSRVIRIFGYEYQRDL
ncbi:unnamed protein product, partial [Wuchereria bancrofti]